jgi:5-hydroxyisourate hydrolase
MKRSPITTHILDLAKGKAASGVPVLLEKKDGAHWREIAKATSGVDGRVENLLTPGTQAESGLYRLVFSLDNYYEEKSFYPTAEVTFRLQNPEQHYHIPLLISNYGFSTYRGT